MNPKQTNIFMVLLALILDAATVLAWSIVVFPPTEIRPIGIVILSVIFTLMTAVVIFCNYIVYQGAIKDE